MGTVSFPRMSPGDKDGRYVGLTTLLSSCADSLDILGSSTAWSPMGQFRPCIGTSLTLTFPGSFPGVKQPGRDVNYPPYFASRLKKAHGFTYTTSLCRHGRLQNAIYVFLKYFYTFVNFDIFSSRSISC